MITRRRAFQIVAGILLLCSVFFHAFSASSAINQQQKVSFLKQTIQILFKARENIINNHQINSNHIKSMKSSEEDFMLFLSYFDGRIHHYCQELLNLKEPQDLIDVPCPVGREGVPESTQHDPVPNTSIQTNTDQIAALEKDFNASLGDFDEMLLKEQETIAQKIPRQQSDTTSSESTTYGNTQENGNSGFSEQQQGQKGGVTEQEGQIGHSGDRKSESQTNKGIGSNSGTGTGRTNQSQLPPTAGTKDLSMNDDDIVAKQLREAAEQETDPEVKAKLWEEYHKYKEGIR